MGNRIIYLIPAMKTDFEAAGFRVYDDFLDAARGDKVADSRTSSTRRLRLVDAESPREFFVKVYYPRTRVGRGWLGRDRAALEAANYRYLQTVCQVPTPRVVCHGSSRSMARLKSSFILTEAVPGAISLDRIVATHWPKPPTSPDPLREALLEQSVRLVRRMHTHAFFHVDLQWRNLLVSGETAQSARLYIIDSSRGGPRRIRLMQEHGRLRDLSSLAKEAASRLRRTEWMRWFIRYLGVRRLGSMHREMIRAVARDRASKDHGGRS